MKATDCAFCYRHLFGDRRAVCAKCRRDPLRKPGFIRRVDALKAIEKKD